jgi:hypothetical protein
MIKKSIYFIVLYGCCISATAQILQATIKFPETIEQGKFFTVEITVKKSKINGFMKYTQIVPKNFEAQAIELKGGIFSVNDTIVKIIWLVPPAEDQFSFTYKLKSNNNSVNEANFVAKMDYLNGPYKENFIFGSAKMVLGEKPYKAVIQPVVKQILASSTNYYYCVQIGVFSNQPDLKGIKEKDIKTIKLDNGLTKYLTGKYDDYNDAFSRLQELKGIGYKDAYIVKLKSE